VNHDVLYNVALTKVPKIGPIMARCLLAHCGSAKDVFHSSTSNLLKIPNIGKIKVSEFKNKNLLIEAEKEIKFANENNVKIIYYLDESYPRRLKHFDQSPIILYYKGEAELNPERSIGMVGTRNPTAQGKVMVERIVADLKPLNPSIISGLAFGIDGAAHKQSLAYQMPTIAVIGHGLDRVYPQEHRELAQRILNQGGGILTEFGQGTLPDRQNFPMRNRIIAALSDAIIVVESKARGGSMITAEFANEYNKDVFAIPGKPSDLYSAGCNGLIKRTKAHLMENVEDLKYIMRWEEREIPNEVQSKLFQDLNKEELEIIESIKKSKEITIDELSFTLNKNSSQLAPLLLNLEFKGAIRSLPGSKYIVI
jgi:DNA processing protein